MAKREAGTIYISLQLATDELKAGIRSLDQQFKRIGQSAQNMGQKMSLAFTLPLAAMGRSAVRSFAEFDQAMADSIAFMGKAGQTMRKELVEGAMQVAATTKFSATEAAKGYQALGQAGLDAAQSIKALPVVADFATAAQTDLADSTRTLLQIQTSLGLTSADATENMKGLTRVADVLARASLDTTVEVKDLATALGSQLGGVLRSNNVSIEDAAAALEVLGAQGIKGAKAGTALGIVIRELGIDFLKNTDAFKKLGIEIFDQAGNYKNIIQVLMDVDRALTGMSDAQRLVAIQSLGFTKRNTQFVQMFLKMSGALERYSQRNREASGAIKEITAVQNAAFGTQMAMALHNIQNVAIAIGEDLAPHVLRATQLIGELVKKFMELPAGLRYTIEGFLAFAAAIGPLTFAWGVLASGFSAVLKILGLLVAPIKWLIAGVGALVTAFGALPVVIGAAFVGAIAAVVVFWDEIKAAAAGVVDWFKATFPELTVVLQAAWILIKDAAVAAWEGIQTFVASFVEWFNNAMTFIADLSVRLWNGIKEFAFGAWEGIKATVNGFLSWFATAFPGITTVATTAWNGIKDIALGVIEQIRAAVETLIGWIKKIFEALGEAKDWVVGKSQEIVAESARNEASQAIAKQAQAQMVANFVTEQGSKISEYFSGVLDKVKTKLGENKKATEDKAATDQKGNEILGDTAQNLDQVLSGLKGTSEGAKQAEKAMDSLNKKLIEAKNNGLGKSFDQQISDAIDNLDRSSFDNLQAQLRESIKQGSLEGLQDVIEKAGPANAAAAKKIAEEIGSAKAEAALAKNEQEWKEAVEKNAKHLEEKQKEAHKNAVDFWRDAFSTAINGGTLDLKSSLKDILIGFAAEIAAAISGGMEQGIKGLGDVGGLIAQGIMGLFGYGSGAGGAAGGGAGGNGAASLIGSAANMGAAYFNSSGQAVYAPEGAIGQNADGTFMMPDGTSQAGTTGSSYTSGAAVAGYVQAGAQIIGAGMSASDTDRANQDNSGTGAAVGAAAGAVIGTVILPGIGTVIGAQLGQIAGGMLGGLIKWGPQNPETQARHAFANFIEEGFAKLETVAFRDIETGRLELFKGDQLNFLEGPSNKFNDGKWAEQFNSLEPKVRGTFLGLGEALEEVLGLTEDVGAQIAYLLAENLGGNIDNARLLVQQLGLSMDDMIEKLVQVGLTGEMTWLEVETGIQGVTEAFKPGLVAVGDIKGAFQDLIDSGGRGMAAIKAVKDIAVEAMEAGARTLEDLKGRLLAQGVNPADVDALMNALRQRGITTLQQLAEVSNRVGGGIVADINASSENMAKTWEEMGKQLDDVSRKLEALPTEIQSNISLNVTANISPEAQQVIDSGVGGSDVSNNIPGGTKKFAKGGLLSSPFGFRMKGGGLGLAGEAGPEFLMPAQVMSDGTLGVRAIGGRGAGGNAVNITVYAPNAAPGMEHKIVEALRKSQQQIVSQTIDAIDRQSTRGGRYG